MHGIQYPCMSHLRVVAPQIFFGKRSSNKRISIKMATKEAMYMATMAMDTSVDASPYNSPLSSAAASASAVSSSNPILLLRLGANDRLELTSEGVAAMSSLPAPVHVHLQVGPTRIGKSTLCNLQLRHTLSPSIAATFTNKFQTMRGHLSHTKVRSNCLLPYYPYDHHLC
jgi:hypothetical protein